MKLLVARTLDRFMNDLRLLYYCSQRSETPVALTIPEERDFF